MEGMMIQVRFDVSRLRSILPDNVVPGQVAELTPEMLDELMEDAETDDEDMGGDYEFDIDGEDAVSQVGGADNDDDLSQEEEYTDAEEPNEQASEEQAPECDEVLATPSALNSQTPPQTAPQATPVPTAMQPQLQPQLQPHSQLQQQPNSLNTMPGGNTPNMEVSLTGGQGMSGDINAELYLSQYDGVKPDFDLMEREDDKAIENINAQLLGIQTGGKNESLEAAKQQGIQSTLSTLPTNPSQSIMMPQVEQVGGYQNQATNQNGLNFSFNPQQAAESRPQLTQMASPMQQQQLQQQSAGGEFQSKKQVSFNNDIKVVELDTKISDGFLYSGSKNLDPFGQ
jgi:hypothetical protein